MHYLSKLLKLSTGGAIAIPDHPRQVPVGFIKNYDFAFHSHHQDTQCSGDFDAQVQRHLARLAVIGDKQASSVCSHRNARTFASAQGIRNTAGQFLFCVG